MGLTQVTHSMITASFVYADDFIPPNVDPATQDCDVYIQQAITAANGKILKFTDGKSYQLGDTLDLSGLRGMFGACYFYWNGPLNGVMFDASMNSGIIISGGVGEMIVRADTPVRAEIAFKMGGTVGYTTFQSSMHNISIVGDTRNDLSNPTIAIDGGPTAANSLNDGEFHRIRIEGFDVGYRFCAPDQKIWGGTCRLEYTAPNSPGAAILLANNGRVQAHGWVVSEAKTPIRCTHGVWGASFYGCWFEGIVQSMAVVTPAGSEIIEGLSYYNCLFSTNAPASHLFNVDNWQPSAVGVANQGQLRLFGCVVSPVSNNSNIQLHSNIAYNPLSVQIYGMQNGVPGKALTFTGLTSQVFWQENGSLKIGNVTGGIARHFTAEATLTYPSIPSSSRDTQNITVTGVRFNLDSASVIATPVDGLLQQGLVFYGWVSADNTVSVVVENYTGGAITPTVRKWRVEVFTH